MPYILEKNRLNYNNLIKEVLEEITKDKDQELAKMRRFIGYMVNNYRYKIYESATAELGFKAIENLSIQLVKRIDQSSEDLFSQAGDFNYIMSSVIWSYLGDNARYGVRAYIRSMVMGYITPGLLFDDKQEILRGVLGDILDELYRRRTAEYEDSKIKENGDVLPLKFN